MYGECLFDLAHNWDVFLQHLAAFSFSFLFPPCLPYLYFFPRSSILLCALLLLGRAAGRCSLPRDARTFAHTLAQLGALFALLTHKLTRPVW